MRITKYPQSCVLVETADARLLVDPGSFAANVHPPETFGMLDAVLYTHRHHDHLDSRLLEPLAEQGVRLVANADTATLLGDHEVTVLADGDTTTIAGVRIRAHELTHCPMIDGSPGPPNLGYVIDDRLLHPGDGIEVPGPVDGVAVPVSGPSISFGDAYRMVREAGASQAVPIHYDGYVVDPERFAQVCDLAEVHVLGDGESVELELDAR
jgi:L-ascorbate metabolism protein UlaG (beta-lactamase superfamily)